MHNPYAAPAPQRDTGPGMSAPGPLALHGRIGRLRFLLYALYGIASAVFVIGLVNHIDSAWNRPGVEAVAILFTCAVVIGLLAYLLIWSRRRFHDMGRSGWFCVLVLAPPATMLALLALLALLLAPGAKEENGFGAVPAEHGAGIIAAAVCALLFPALWMAFTLFATQTG